MVYMAGFQSEYNFKYLDDLIHSGVKEIVLDSDIALSGSEESGYSDGISLDVDDLIIDGAGHTIDAARKARIFHCSGRNITVKNLILKNGFCQMPGSAIYNDCEGLKIQGCIFLSNAGISLYNLSQLDICKSHFLGNASDCESAISNSGILTVRKSGFISNAGDGLISNEFLLNIFDCEFRDNSCTGDLIFNENQLQANSTLFTHNKSENIIACTLISHAGMTDVEFRHNDVIKSVIRIGQGSCTIERGLFEGNVSFSSKNIINESDLTLINPKVNDGGVTVLNEGHVLLRGCSKDFERKIGGSGIVEVDEVPPFEKYDFGYLDSLIHDGGGDEIVLKQNISLEIYESDFYEGGIELDIDNMIIDGKGMAIDARGRSRIFLVRAENVTLKNITFKNAFVFKNYDNAYNSQGGAVKVARRAGLTVENCRFINNVCEDNGGAIYNRSKLHIRDSKFFDNSAKGLFFIDSGGGAVYNDHGLMVVSDSLFCRNSGEVISGGGAVYNNGGRLTVSGTEFCENAAERGGAITSNVDDFELNDCKFSLNEPDDVDFYEW